MDLALAGKKLLKNYTLTCNTAIFEKDELAEVSVLLCRLWTRVYLLNTAREDVAGG